MAAWRLPGAGFDTWARSRAHAYGLGDEIQVDEAVRRTAVLMNRFQQHRLFRRITAAEKRWHEVPYSLEEDGRIERGIIDLLIFEQQGWTLVDFKTDWIKSDAELTAWLKKTDYEEQMLRYGRAVSLLVGQIPRISLCLLNVGGKVRLHSVLMEPRQ